MNLKTLPSRIHKSILFLAGGLLLHFIFFTFTEFRLGFTGPIVTVLTLWKEFLILAIGGGVAWHSYKNGDFLKLQSDKIFSWGVRLFIGAIIRSLITTLLINQGTMTSVISGFKYDWLRIAILLIGYMIGLYLSPQQSKYLQKRRITCIKIVVFTSLARFCILIVKPGILNRIGYSTGMYEGKLDSKPPAVYYTAYDHGSPRNQFLFERPITYGFWLIAWFPLFYYAVMYRKKFSQTRFWWLVYGLAILSTISRAAWGARIIQLIIIGFISYRDQLQKFLLKIVVPIIVITAIVITSGYYYIFGGGRQFSDTGHINSFKKAMVMFIENPIAGLGAGSAGPASFQSPEHEPFNPENQYLQILVSYGLIGFMPRIIIYGYLNRIGRKGRREKRNSQKNRQTLMALSLGIGGLSICGFVLHPFVDRMVLYRFVLFFGIWLSNSFYNRTPPTTGSQSK